jgi:hypothetical protein
MASWTLAALGRPAFARRLADWISRHVGTLVARSSTSTLAPHASPATTSTASASEAALRVTVLAATLWSRLVTPSANIG